MVKKIPTPINKVRTDSNQAIRDKDRLITDRDVANLISSSRSWPWRLSREGRFPKPIRLSNRCTRWRLSDVKEWLKDPESWQENSQRGAL